MPNLAYHRTRRAMQTVHAGAGRRQRAPPHVLVEGVEDVGPVVREREVDKRVIIVELPRDVAT